MFLMTSMLAGLLAVGIPVVVHLLHRQRTTPVRWGAMQFLVESRPLLKRRKRLDHWLLMLLRMAAVALLVLALSRPVQVRGTGAALGAAGGRGATDVAVVVDRSLSMGRRAGDTSAYDAAVAALADVVKTLGPNDTLSVVLAEHTPRAHSIRLSPGNAADAARKLKDLGPGGTAANIPEAVQAARELVAAGNNPRKTVLVLSDEQRSNWAIDDEPAWRLATRGTSPAAQDRVAVYAVPFGMGGRAPNLSVRDLTLAPDLIGRNRLAEITATVANAGPEPFKNVNVRLAVDGRPADARLLAEVPAGESRTVRFEHAFREAGSHSVAVQADIADALDADNVAVVGANVWERVPILVIDGQLSGAGDLAASQFLRAAMQPVEAAAVSATLLQPKVVSVSEAAALGKWDEFFVVVVNDAPRLPPELAGRLADFARGGRGVWVIFGPRTEQSLVTRGLADAGLLVANASAPKRAAADAGEAIEIKDASHPAVRLIAAAERNAFTGSVVRTWWPVVPQTGDAHVILATPGGDPLAFERPLGSSGGRVMVWCTSADANPAWNNWPLRPSFVPLVNETIHHLAAGQTRGLENRQVISGRQIVWTAPAEPRVDQATVTRPDNTTTNLTPRVAGARQVVTFNEASQPGLYQLRFDNTAVPQPVYYGVGADPRELEPATLSEADQEWLKSRDFIERRLTGPAELTSASGAETQRREIWPILAAILMAALLAESFMTWRVTRHQAGT